MQTAEGIKKVMALREDGHYCGGHVPYGMKVESGKLVQCEKELEVLQKAAVFRAKGETWTHICLWLEVNDHFPRRTNRWNPTVLSKLCRKHGLV